MVLKGFRGLGACVRVSLRVWGLLAMNELRAVGTVPFPT